MISWLPQDNNDELNKDIQNETIHNNLDETKQTGYNNESDSN